MATARRQLGYVSSLTTQGIPLMTYGVATGGSSASRTISGQNYTVLTFTSDSNLEVTTAGLFDVLLVGGGGAAGTDASHGGGGAGALVGFASTTTIYLAAGTYAVDIGAGGSIGAWDTSGAASYIGSIISAAGGGGGGTKSVGTPAYGFRGFNGGSGGGSIETQNPAAYSIDETFGNDGGIGNGASSNAGGGGGGYASAGGTQASNTVGGTGGNGIDVSSWGTSASTDNIAAGGGGGGTSGGGAAGTGGVAAATTQPRLAQVVVVGTQLLAVETVRLAKCG
jgi:hypothetical protein